MTAGFRLQPEWLNLDWHRAMVDSERVCAQRCGPCHRWRLPPRRFCPECFSLDYTFEPVSGNGRIVSWAVSHRSLHPAWSEQTPYVTAVVELLEGPRLLGATQLAPESMAVGLPVQVRVEPAGEDLVLIWADEA